MANILAMTLLLIVIATGGNAVMAGAQSTPPSSSSCTASLVSLAPCLAFLQGGPNNTTPTQGCCTSLASVVNTNAPCLCQLITTTNNSLGIPINQTQALALPGACKITTPPVSQCKSPAVSSPPAAAPSSPAPVVSNPTPTTPASAPSSPTPVVSNPTPTPKSPAASSPPAAAPSSPTPVVSNPTPTAKSPSTKEGPTASANAGSMMGVSTLIQLVGIMGSLTFITSASII